MRIIYILALLLLLIRCNKDVTLDLPEPELKPTVYSYPSSGKVINLSLTNSYPITTNDDNIDANINTSISLFVDGIFKEYLTYNKGNYASKYKPVQNDSLEIELSQSIEYDKILLIKFLI